MVEDSADPEPEHPGGQRREMLSAVVYKEIKKRIFANELRQGSKVPFGDLAAALGVSRTPIREALERLCEEGFVRRVPNRGYSVAQIDRTEVDDLFGLREALEVHALRQSLKNGLSLEQIERVKHFNRRYAALTRDPRTRDRMMADRDFHLTLASFAGNRALLRALDEAFERIILKLNIDGYSSSYGQEGLNEHCRLMDALVAGDNSAAGSILAEHIGSARLRVLDHLERDRSLEFYAFEEASSATAKFR